MELTRINTGKYKIPLKIRNSKVITQLENRAGSLKTNNSINIDDLNDTLELINDNYDTFRTIFLADDSINVNKDIKQETAGLLINLFNKHTKQYELDPIHVPNYNFKPWPKDLATFISAGFDNEEYNKNKGGWAEKNITDFKKLFD